MQRIFAAILLALALAPLPAGAKPASPSYRKLPSIALADGRWDLLSVDVRHNRVLIARGESVTVVDPESGKTAVLGTISRGHAAVPIDGTDLVAVTSGGDDTVRLIDMATGQETARIDVGDNPDAALYDAASKHLIVMNAEGGTVSIVDPFAKRVVKTIMVKPALELAVLVGRDLLAINNEDAGEIELVDLKSGVAGKPIALAGCEGPTGIAFDRADRLLLSACANGVAAVVDARSHKVTQLLPIGKGPDGALFNRRTHQFLVPSGQSGTLSVFAVVPHRKLAAEPDVATEIGARTAALDPASGRVYLPTATFAPAVGTERPKAIAGTAHLIVLEPRVQ